MKPTNTNLLAHASKKSARALILEQALPVLDMVREMRQGIEALSAEVGLKIMHRCMEEEIAQRCGSWGSQSHYRHGSQWGYVVFHGRKVPIPRPRLRDKASREAALETYRLFQQDAPLQRAVARQLIRQVSTRNYADAIEDCLEGYGIEKSSISRHWKAATAIELEKLCRRPVPSDLVALIKRRQAFEERLRGGGFRRHSPGQKACFRFVAWSEREQRSSHSFIRRSGGAGAQFVRPAPGRD